MADKKIILMYVCYVQKNLMNADYEDKEFTIRT